MKYVKLHDGVLSRPLPFYLAMEEYLARTRQEDDLWFWWIVPPTVIIGRNQLMDTEVNMPYCREHGIQVYRRKSGGGCVYSDYGNVMFSYVCHSNDVETTFRRYTAAVADMLRSLGIDAEATGRNDILVGGRKVSGNAFYHVPGRSIVHGTMLYDTDFGNMANAISPPASKLQSKGVSSVRQRIATLKPLIDLSLQEFVDYAREHMTDSTIELGPGDVEAIDVIMQEYLRPEWICGRNPRASVNRSARLADVGGINVAVELSGGCIADINFSGDFFITGDLDALAGRLRRVAYSREAIEAALKPADVGSIIHGLTAEDLINLII